jgi:alcohol dehydrogenase, propanol-preferring
VRAMVLDTARSPLRLAELPRPIPADEQVLIRVHACGVCRTDLHIMDGDLPHPKLPLILGHEVVGTVVSCGAQAADFGIGDRVGVPWLSWTCGVCAYCRSGRENLCGRARFTGYEIDGGYAEYALADRRYVFKLPAG